MKMLASKHVVGGVLGTVVVMVTPLVMLAAPPGKPPVVLIPIRPLNMKAAAKVSWSKDIHPLLQKQCVTCHATNDKDSGLDASNIPALLKGGKKAGPSVIPGKPDKSPLVLYIRGLKKPQMPIRHKPLSVDQVHLIREWIAAGAKAH